MTSIFASRVAGLFATRISTFLIGLVATLLLARLLGPDGRGAYTLLLLIPTTILTIGQLGIPSALVYFTGRGRSLDELRTGAALLVPVLSIVTIVPTLMFADELRRTVLVGTPQHGLELVLVAIPFLFASSLAGSILLGRQEFRKYNLISLGQTGVSLLLIVVLVGLAGLGVVGAIWSYVLVVVGAASAYVVAALRLAPFKIAPALDAARALVRYGLRIFPASVATFFGYRADVFLLSLILASPRAVGLYGLAVGLAELVFYVPDAISNAFFPRISSSDRGEADRLAPEVTRITVLLTVVAAIGLVPMSIIAVHLLVPAFVDSLPALFVILPGIVGMSVSKVLSSYVSGLGKPLPIGTTALISLAINLVANLAFIPLWGFVGAAAASLLSYSAEGIMLVAIASRLAGVPVSTLVLPRVSDARRLGALANDLTRDLLARRPARLGSRG